MDNFEKLLLELDIKFNNLNIFKQAFIHSSYVNEHDNENLEDNERLEYLGDAVLELVVSEYLFENKLLNEGEMSKLRSKYVCEYSLFLYAKKLNFGDYILLGKGEINSNGFNRPTILSDVFEAFIAAIYLDLGLCSVKKFFNKFIVPIIEENSKKLFIDYKTKLQEMIQSENKTVRYILLEELGEPHDKEFIVAVKIGRKIISKGVGKSKKDAERQAAKIALLKLEKK
ncbi:Ribonuclease III [Methanococcus vannielii SB]|uniref:ribonuclease III n=1 Tax=Methanococcus vannielii (strain ATCC 35089 / DSM 1224 / JCM 13029 / OCM 148 / SB) TaxID=406327 RepID=A6UQH3_METVS|nr:ribonuclease III [Methanococcus vannielii]ABR54745.1 Ribonuclease III [Methanococcus vannielii SB]